MPKESGQGVRSPRNRNRLTVRQTIKAGSAHSAGIDAPAILPNNQKEMKGARLGTEGGKPDETRPILAKRADAKRLGTIEVGKLLFTQEGTIRLLMDFTGSQMDLTNAVADWLERFRHEGPPRMDVVIVRTPSGRPLPFRRLFNVFLENRVTCVETALGGAR